MCRKVRQVPTVARTQRSALPSTGPPSKKIGLSSQGPALHDLSRGLRDPEAEAADNELKSVQAATPSRDHPHLPQAYPPGQTPTQTYPSPTGAKLGATSMGHNLPHSLPSSSSADSFQKVPFHYQDGKSSELLSEGQTKEQEHSRTERTRR